MFGGTGFLLTCRLLCSSIPGITKGNSEKEVNVF
jgi:hypothetical protein